eukprot:748290-Rhodomonas_salina.7
MNDLLVFEATPAYRHGFCRWVKGSAHARTGKCATRLMHGAKGIDGSEERGAEESWRAPAGVRHSADGPRAKSRPSTRGSDSIRECTRNLVLLVFLSEIGMRNVPAQ